MERCEPRHRRGHAGAALGAKRRYHVDRAQRGCGKAAEALAARRNLVDRGRRRFRQWPLRGRRPRQHDHRDGQRNVWCHHPHRVVGDLHRRRYRHALLHGAEGRGRRYDLAGADGRGGRCGAQVSGQLLPLHQHARRFWQDGCEPAGAHRRPGVGWPRKHCGRGGVGISAFRLWVGQDHRDRRRGHDCHRDGDPQQRPSPASDVLHDHGHDPVGQVGLQPGARVADERGVLPRAAGVCPQPRSLLLGRWLLRRFLAAGWPGYHQGNGDQAPDRQRPARPDPLDHAERRAAGGHRAQRAFDPRADDDAGVRRRQRRLYAADGIRLPAARTDSRGHRRAVHSTRRAQAARDDLRLRQRPLQGRRSYRPVGAYRRRRRDRHGFPAGARYDPMVRPG